MSKIYKNGNEFYKMIRPVGSWSFQKHYALWRPVKKFLSFWVSNGKQDFWLDMMGFKKFNARNEERHRKGYDFAAGMILRGATYSEVENTIPWPVNDPNYSNFDYGIEDALRDAVKLKIITVE
jgi:hypothetical protein